DRAPLAALHPHRHSEVIDGLAPRRDRLLDQRLARGGGARRHRALHRAPHTLGVAAVDGHLAVGVEDERVAHVVLGGGLRDVLLERRVVIEEQRAVGDRREVPRQHLATPLELVDDRDALAMVDHDEDARHHERDHEDRAPERSEEHTSELQSPCNLVCRLLLEKKKKEKKIQKTNKLQQPFQNNIPPCFHHSHIPLQHDHTRLYHNHVRLLQLQLHHTS